MCDSGHVLPVLSCFLWPRSRLECMDLVAKFPAELESCREDLQPLGLVELGVSAGLDNVKQLQP